MKPYIILTLLILFTVRISTAQDMDYKSNENQPTADDAELIQVLDEFRTAIINNDQKKASDLLINDARILESGSIETKEEYLSHHFHSDGKFLSAMERETTSQEVKTTEQTAWISTVSHLSGTYNDRDIKINSAELAVLVKTTNGWKISAVHWSSGNAD